MSTDRKRRRHLRKPLGLSQAELATKLLVSRHSVSEYERGQTVPSRPILRFHSLLLLARPAEARPILESLKGFSGMARLSGRDFLAAEVKSGGQP